MSSFKRKAATIKAENLFKVLMCYFQRYERYKISKFWKSTLVWLLKTRTINPSEKFMKKRNKNSICNSHFFDLAFPSIIYRDIPMSEVERTYPTRLANNLEIRITENRFATNHNETHSRVHNTERYVFISPIWCNLIFTSVRTRYISAGSRNWRRICESSIGLEKDYI